MILQWILMLLILPGPNIRSPVFRSSMITVASWNVRGLNGIDHQRAVEQLMIVKCVGAVDTSVSMAEFRSCILDNGLVQLPFTGCPFTWHNCSEGTRSLWKRLDRMLVNEAWLETWPGASYISALPSTSDHSPLVLNGTNRGADRAIFRFDNYLAQQPGFLSSVENIWKHHITGTTMYEIVNKLKLLKAEFRRQRQIKGNLTENVKRAKEFLDKAQELFATYKEDILLHLVKCCRQVYSEAIKLEISMLKQRAKLRWMKHGDQNSKVFFRKVNSTRAKQRVFQIKKTTVVIRRLQSHRVLDIEFLRQDIKHTLTTDEANQLVAPVTRSEIKAAFFDIDETVLQVLMDTPRFFLELPGQWLDKQSMMLLETFSEQNAFVPGRNISDNILLAQELLAGYNQVRFPSRCTLKVDIQKAYDSVEWDFLLEVLRLFNFPPQFIKLIEQCVSTVSYSIALNGSVYGFFKGRRGLRQGDPMSPYLFVLVMEIWSSLLRYRVKNAAQFQYHWKCKDVGLINLCFADDVLLFCKAHIPSIRVLTDTLSEFVALSGLTVNPAKNQIILSRAVQQERQQIIDSLGFQKGVLPVKYLGVPLTSSRLTIADCRPLINKLDARLAGWNHQNLSYAGRVQLIKTMEPQSGWTGFGATGYNIPHFGPFNGATGSWGWKKMVKLRPLLRSGLIYKVGNGSTFRLWQDIWHDQGPLCLSHPNGPTITGLPMNSPLAKQLG
ncbi:UNVERIFIED_CONTAM: hypothetical protein Sangu_3070300 [Sesamum angustifolium]|uniref:Reverse transcriptase domain-containing protein n=1 Tax=Sesamum angustifolium TaxID=2727405 RepID=A0AAW2KE29_9LAMI